MDQQQGVENTDHHQSDVDGLVLRDTGIGKHIVPVHRRWQHHKPGGERRQMRGQALRLLMIGQRSHYQAVPLPLIIPVQIVAARCIHSQFVVGREVRALVFNRWAVAGRAVDCIHLTQTKDHRLMSDCLLIVDKVGVDTVLAQIRRAEGCPPIDEIDRAIELGCSVKSVDDQIGKGGIEGAHLEVHGDRVVAEVMLMKCRLNS